MTTDNIGVVVSSSFFLGLLIDDCQFSFPPFFNTGRSKRSVWKGEVSRKLPGGAMLTLDRAVAFRFLGQRPLYWHRHCPFNEFSSARCSSADQRDTRFKRPPPPPALTNANVALREVVVVVVLLRRRRFLIGGKSHVYYKEEIYG